MGGIKYDKVLDKVRESDFDLSVQSTTGEMLLSAPADTTFTLANTDYKLNGVFIDGLNQGFSIDSSGILTAEPSAVSGIYLALGSAVLRCSSNNTTVTLQLYVNGESAGPKYRITAEFAAVDRRLPVAIGRLAQINPGDYIEIYASSSTAGAILTVDSLDLLLHRA